MRLTVCEKCKRPYLADKDRCPNCPEPYAWDQESWVNLGCTIAMLLPLLGLLIFWFVFFLGILAR